MKLQTMELLRLILSQSLSLRATHQQKTYGINITLQEVPTGGGEIAYTNIQAPSISGEFAHFKGHKSGGDPSFCGIYQQLSGLTVGKTYEIDITNPYQLIEGTITVKTYRKEGDTVFESSSNSFTMPYINGNMSATFTATTQNDVILIDYTTESTSAVVQHIYAMRISELQEYLVPTYAQDVFGNDHKILRRNLGNTISDD